MTAFFLFEGDRLACERVYFDALTMLKQLLLSGVSWRDPASVLRLARAVVGLRRGLA